MPCVLIDDLGFKFYSRLDANSSWHRLLDEQEVHLVTHERCVALSRWPGVASTHLVEEGVANLERVAGRVARDVGARYVVALNESLVSVAARLRTQLDLPGQREDEAKVFRNKMLMKDHLRSEVGVRVPEFRPFTPAGAASLLDKCGKVVIKPHSGSGSVGIHIVSDRSDIETFVGKTPPSKYADFEVEEFIPGQVCHVDSVVHDGQVIVANAGRALRPTTSWETLSEYRDSDFEPGHERDSLLRFNSEVLSAYPGFSGVTHMDVILGDQGPVFCEVAARFGGGGIVPGFLHRTGVNLVAAMIAAQLAEPMPVPSAMAADLTGFMMLYVPRGILQSPVEVLDASWVINTQAFARVGVLRERPSAWPFSAVTVTLAGESEEELYSRMDRVSESTRIEMLEIPEA